MRIEKIESKFSVNIKSQFFHIFIALQWVFSFNISICTNYKVASD